MIRNNKLICDNRSISSMYVHGVSKTTILPDRERIPKKNKRRKISEIPITGNQITQESDNQSKKNKSG